MTKSKLRHIPNILSLSRIPLAIALPFLGELPIAFLCIYGIAGLNDVLDGWLARKMAQVTDFGRLIDPLADKILVMAAMVYLVAFGDISPWVLILIESREFIISGMRMVAANKGIVIAAGIWGKVKTVVQMIMIPTVLIGVDHVFFWITERVLIYGAVLLSVISAITYIWQNKQIFEEGASA